MSEVRSGVAIRAGARRWLTRVATVAVGLFTFGSVTAAAVPQAQLLATIRGEAVQYYSWPAGTETVGVDVGEDLASVTVVEVPRTRAPQIYLTRSCVIATPIDVHPAGDGWPAGAAQVEPAPGWRGCHTSLVWQIPPQTSTVLQGRRLRQQDASIDRTHREELQNELMTLEEERRQVQVDRAALEAKLAARGITPAQRAQWQADLAGRVATQAGQEAEQKTLTDQIARLDRDHRASLGQG